MNQNIAAPAIGVILSLGFLVASVTQRAPHWLALAGVALALGLVGGALGTGWSAMHWMFVALGSVMALVGAARFRRFAARNPVEARE